MLDIARFSLVAAALAASFVLAFYGIEGWGWFLFAAILMS